MYFDELYSFLHMRNKLPSRVNSERKSIILLLQKLEKVQIHVLKALSLHNFLQILMFAFVFFENSLVHL